jgi:FMN reductase
MSSPSQLQILAIDGSPSGNGRTRRAIDGILRGAMCSGACATVKPLAKNSSPDPVAEALVAARDADAFVIGVPVYRASYSATLKTFLDALPRGMWGETDEPVRARATAIVLTGASWHHYLALADLRNVLASFFAAHVLSPGLYVPSDGFSDTKELLGPFEELARLQGAALVDLATAVAASSWLQRIRPQA